MKNYLNNRNLKAAGQSIGYTREQAKEFARCAADPVYFIKKYCKIVHVDKGLIPFKLYGYQEDFVRTIDENRFSIAKWCRQSGKSTTSAAWMLHHVMFNKVKRVAILANKAATSREILSRIQLMYEHIPLWLQQGVVTWNKGSIELENGSTIIAAATSSSGIRGLSISTLFLDEVAFIPEGQFHEFFESVYPTISSGEETRVIMVSTPKGMNHFWKLWNEAVEKRSQFKPVAIEWWQVPGRNEKWKAETISNIGQEKFDQEFGAEFLGSFGTLITGNVLRRLTYATPIEDLNGMLIYEQPEQGHSYALTVDCSEGVGADASTFHVIDITTKPFKQVAVFKDNRMSPLVFPETIYRVGTAYANASVLIETNSVGQQVASILQYDYGYDNILWVGQSTKGQILMGGSGTTQRPGLQTNRQSKRIGCSNLKALIEQDLLVINDADTIQELSQFIKKGTSFEADDGANDDLVMALVVFAWMSSQEYFKELNNVDVRERTLNSWQERLESDLLPHIMSTTNEDEVIVEIDKNGIVWTLTTT